MHSDLLPIGVRPGVPADPTERPSEPSDVEPEEAAAEAQSEPWEAAIQAVAGACRVRNIPPQELAAVASAMQALEAELEEPIRVADRLMLGTLARVVLLEHRASRLSFERGILTAGGEIRPTVGEYRQLARLKLDVLGRLRFKPGKPGETLTEILRTPPPAAAAASAPRHDAHDDQDVAEGLDRATARQDASDAGQPADASTVREAPKLASGPGAESAPRDSCPPGSATAFSGSGGGRGGSRHEGPPISADTASARSTP